MTARELREALNKITQEFREEAKEMADAMREYLDEMTEKKHHGKIDAEVIARMQDSMVSMGRMADALIFTSEKKYRNLRVAIMYSLGAMQLNEGNWEKAKEGILDAIRQNSNEDYRNYGWLAFTFMDQGKKLEIAKAYTKGMGQEGLKRFAREASAAGALSTAEIKHVIGEDKYEKGFTAEEKQSHQVAYKGQHDFSEQAKTLLTTSYGAYNQTGSMLTLKNILLSVVAAGGIFSAGFSTILDLWKGGKIKSAEGIVGAVVNVQNGIKLGTAYAATKLMSKNSLGAADDTAIENPDAQPEFVDNLKTTIAGNTKWHEFFVSGEHKGASLFGLWSRYALVKHKGEDPESFLKIEEFSDWLKMKKHTDAIASFEKVKGDPRTTDEEVKTLALSFKALGIGAATAKKNYEKHTKITT
ncbi:hypothetical protein HN709_02180 [Candidatus Peregrinibacteria bacterium]|nr:hypothetical protein [Candidatus Peregrinibacteria bacterium]